MPPCPCSALGTIPPIKSAQGEGDDVKKLFTIACPVILATLGVALLFIIRKKRKEKRLKRLRGEMGFRGTEHGTPDCVLGLPRCALKCSLTKNFLFFCVSCTDAKSLAEMLIR